MEPREIYRELKSEIVGEVRMAEPMSHHTTWRIGGPADVFIEPRGVEDLRRAIVFAGTNGIPLLVIGNGSNLLVSDHGIRGLVIKICKGMSVISTDGNLVTAEAGVRLSSLLKVAMGAGLGGFEFVAGIPGNVGGAVVMNAGANGSSIADLLHEVTVMDYAGDLHRYKRSELDFGYRFSSLQDLPEIVVWATFACRPQSQDVIREKTEAYLRRRRETQPLKHPNAGSVFKNPPGDSAGRLIELAGAKGLKFGGIQVSEVHANFFVNIGRGTASDVLQAVETVRRMVKDKFGLTLSMEVKFIGEQCGGGDSIAKVYDLRGQQPQGYS